MIAAPVSPLPIDGSGSATGAAFRPAGPWWGDMIELYDRVGDEVLVGDTGTGIPKLVSLTGGGFVMVWRDDTYLPGSEVREARAQVFDASGSPAGASFLIAPGVAYYPPTSVIALADGGFAAAWRASDDAGGGPRLVIQRYQASGAADGVPLVVPGFAGADPAIAELADGSIALTWESGEGTDSFGIRAQVYSAEGDPLAPATLLASQGIYSSANPTIAALDDGGFLVTWFRLDGPPYYRRTSHAQLLDEAGVPIGSPFPIGEAASGDQQYSQATALADGRFVIVWTDLQNPNSAVEEEIRGQIYAADGSTIGDEFAINTEWVARQLAPSVTRLPSGGFAVSWMTSEGAGAGTASHGVGVQIFDADGGKVGTEFIAGSEVTGDEGMASIIALASGTLVVAWETDREVRFQMFDASVGDGVNDLALSTASLGDQTIGGMIVAQIDPIGGAVNAPVRYEIVADSRGAFAIVNGALVVTDPRKLALEFGPIAEIRIRATDGSGIPFEKSFTFTITDQPDGIHLAAAGDEFLVNTHTGGYQTAPAPAVLAGGDYAIAWYSEVGYNQGQIRAQLFDGDGDKIGTEVVVSSSGGYSPSIAAVGNGFVVTWLEVGSGAASIRGQRFGADGSPAGSAFDVATAPVNRYLAPLVEPLADGGFVVAWSTNDGVNPGSDAFVQRYDDAGAKIGSAMRLSATTTGIETVTGLAPLAAGGFLVSWMDQATGGSVMVRLSHYSATGTRIGSDFIVDGTGWSNVRFAAQADGGFAMIWQEAVSSHRDAVKVQLFDAAGTPIGDEMVFEEGDFYHPVAPTIEALPDGGYIASWNSKTTPTSRSSLDVVAQLIDATARPIGDRFVLTSVTIGHQQSPEIAVDREGGFIVGWTDQSYLGGDTSGLAAKARIFSGLDLRALALDDQFTTAENAAFDGRSLFAAHAMGADRPGADGTLQVVEVNGAAAAVGQTITLASGATLLVRPDGTFRYNPNGAFNQLHAAAWEAYGYATTATDSFTYAVAGGSTATATIRITGLGGPGATINGTANDDVLTGTPDVDRLNGAAGDDTLRGQAGNDTLDGGADDDMLDGGAGADLMLGGFGNDTYIVENVGDRARETSAAGGEDIVRSAVSFGLEAYVETLILTGAANSAGAGNASANLLVGNSGANRLDGGAGGDTLRGGFGNDTYVVDDAADVAEELAGQGSDTIESSIDWTLAANIENLILTGAAVTGTGNDLANGLTGSAGANFLVGAGGDDRIDGAAGGDYMVGGFGNDIYVVDNIGDRTEELAGRGTDLVESNIVWSLAANVENLRLTGTAAINGTGNGLANLLTGNSAANTLSGGEGHDILDGREGADRLEGGTGNDNYHADASDILIELAGHGTDTVFIGANYTLGANIENLALTGTAGVNGTGNELANQLNGNSGSNWLDGAAGADLMLGGLGDDTYVVDHLGDRARETSASGGADTVRSAVSYNLEAYVETLILTGTAHSAANGSAIANLIIGNSGGNRLNGMAGADTLRGGLGNDTFLVDNVGDLTEELAGEGVDAVESSITWALAANIENLKLIGGAAIDGTGNDLGNAITGNYAANTLAGGDGNDTLNGGQGADRLEGGTGNDIYYADTSDTLVEAAGAGIDTVFIASGHTLGANFENLALTGTADVNGTGNDLANQLSGNAGSNLLDGGIGADVMLGGLGDDTYIVDHSGDRARETSAIGGVDTVRSSVSFTLEASLESLILTGSATIDGIGNATANQLTGNGSDNRLTGGHGADILTGGGGNDVFAYVAVGDSTAANRDSIQAFDATDLIDLRRLDAVAGTAADDVFTFIGAAAFGNVAGELRAYQSGTDWLVEGDTNGDGTADLVIAVTTAADLDLTGAAFLL